MKITIIALICLNLVASSLHLSSQTPVLHNFITETNNSCYNGVITDGIYIYGTKTDGGTNGKGYIYKTKIDGSSNEILLNFDGKGNGALPAGSFVFKNDTLFGITQSGGENDYGTIYGIKKDGTGYFKLLDFNGTNGGNTFNTLTISENVLYVASVNGGSNGLLFKINIDGSGYSILHNFNGINGWNPSSPLAGEGDVLYGTTLRGAKMTMACFIK